eukprot:COSAG02_NODE_5766_length_4055_cov_2.385996_5_plen_85_part_00
MSRPVLLRSLVALLLYPSPPAAPVAVAVAAAAVPLTAAIPAARPPAGWSTWTTFKCDINETLVYEAIDALLTSGLAKSGYEYVL